MFDPPSPAMSRYFFIGSSQWPGPSSLVSSGAEADPRGNVESAASGRGRASRRGRRARRSSARSGQEPLLGLRINSRLGDLVFSGVRPNVSALNPSWRADGLHHGLVPEAREEREVISGTPIRPGPLALHHEQISGAVWSMPMVGAAGCAPPRPPPHVRASAVTVRRARPARLNLDIPLKLEDEWPSWRASSEPGQGAEPPPLRSRAAPRRTPSASAWDSAARISAGAASAGVSVADCPRHWPHELRDRVEERAGLRGPRHGLDRDRVVRGRRSHHLVLVARHQLGSDDRDHPPPRAPVSRRAAGPCAEEDQARDVPSGVQTTSPHGVGAAPRALQRRARRRLAGGPGGRRAGAPRWPALAPAPPAPAAA